MAMLADDVDLVPVPAAGRHVFENLLQLYLHDFSEFAGAGSPYGHLDEDGRFSYASLDSYWQDDERHALLIRYKNAIAGFVLVNRWSASDRALDHAVAEFFVARKFRRIGLGAEVARQLFNRFPGRWEVPVAIYNAPALAFWTKAIARADVEPVEAITGDGIRWTGTIFCFEAQSAQNSGSS